MRCWGFGCEWGGADFGPVGDPPYLNDPAAVARGLTITLLTETAISFVSNSGDTRRGYSLPAPVADTTIEFDVVTDNTLYFRLDTSTNLDPTDHIEIISPLAAGTHHVVATIPAHDETYQWMGFLTQVIGQNVQITNWRVTLPVVPAHPLQPYFDSGTIVIYFDTDGATLNGSGQVIGLTNRGAGGAAFNATVSGNPIPLTGNAMQMSSTTGNCIMATAADIMDVRMMWACSTEGMVSSMRFMGSASDEIRIGAIQAGSPPSAFLQFWSNRSGSGVSINPTPRIPIPTSGMHLFESEMSYASQYLTAWFDGPQVATIGAVAHTAFTVDRIGQGTGSTLQFVGQMGGVLGVLTGRPDTAAAIAAVRSYWTTRFGLVLT
ncbi:hypothetical protein [Paracoccus sp. DMF]|uniref:hypothetical protein n=1 Tax=Paracoccus sp. DMF TaxID=400837 RepID=UPI0021E4CDFF|nr:hypothetical protein [Paracoccus sp. DMF]MCV2448884.1 hypothetical protein [Paracoccus sp. DMF]